MSAALEVSGREALRWGMALLSDLGFSDEVIRQLREVSDGLNVLAGPGTDVLPGAAEGRAGTLADALRVVEGFPVVVQRNEVRGIPFEVTARTLRDLERRMREYRQREGKWGFDRLNWMQNHLRGELFEIGRLQFAPGGWRESFDVFVSRETGSVWPLAQAGLGCDADGRPGVENAVFQTIRKDVGPVCGHPADVHSGLIRREWVVLPDAERAVTRGDAVLHVHIPSGPNFTPQACASSLLEARRFFERHFPEFAFKAICCRTWLLDPAWQKILPSDSHISQFGRLFRPLVVPGADDAQHRERIFGLGVDWKNDPPKTRLQTLARDYLLGGGKFSLASGFVLWSEMRGDLGNSPMNLFGQND